MSTDKDEPIFKEESQKIIGCAMEVHNELGYGFHEKSYERALMVEFELRNIHFEQQKTFELIYKSKNVGDYIPDLIVYHKIKVDT